jgi:hypothetical protein
MFLCGKTTFNCIWSTTTGATSGAGTVYPSGAPEFTPGGIPVALFFSFFERNVL